jgi:hypothetical protein
MQPPKSDVCVICGIRAATTHDHVPPKGFFKGSKNAALVKVPACAPCNNGASSDDEDMRFYMSMQVGKQTPESSRLWEQGAHKSVKRKTALRNHVLGTAREMQVLGEDGRPVVRLAVEVPGSLYDAVFSRTVRGLYFFHTARILNRACQTEVSPLVSRPEDPLIEELHYNEIGGHACKYWYGVDSEDLDASLWLFQFYGAHWIQVTTGALCGDDA